METRITWTMRSETSAYQVFRRLLVRVGAYELTGLLPILLIWSSLLGLADWRVLIGLTTVRLAWVYLSLRRRLEPYLRGSADPDALGDSALLEVDRVLQTAPRGFAIDYVCGWMLVLFAATGLGLLGWPTRLLVGDAELLCGGLLLVAIVCGQFTVLIAIFSSALLDARVGVSEHLLERRLATQRQPSSHVQAVIWLNAPISLAVFTGMCSIASMVTVDAWRTAALAEQRQLATQAALDFELLAEIDGDVTLVEPDELPPPLDPASTLAAIDEAESIALAAAPLSDGRYVLARATIDERLRYIVAFVLVGPLMFLPLQIFANRSLAGALGTQLGELGRAVREVLTTGKLRGIKRFRPPSNDEVGRLASDFNDMLDMLDELAEVAHEVAGGGLAADFERSGDLHEAFRGMLAQLRAIVGQIRATALELAGAAAEIHAATEQQEHVLELQSRRIVEVGSTVELLATAAEDITRIVTQVLTNAEQTLSNTDTTVARIGELNAQVTSITQLLELIREVADRSDLLALNGSLEATRAGDAGRGFGLVAAEMRRLAERVAGAVTDVRERITNIGHTGNSTVLASAQSRALAERTAADARRISAVTATQYQDTHRVSHAMQEVALSASATAAATAQTRMTAEGLRMHAVELERLTRHFRIGDES
jgi:methyl-accepting chemotaxis protein